MTQSNRIDTGLVDYNQPLNFRFNGKQFRGFKGDTLASALIANGRLMIGRSFKYHRPRGIFSAGSEEPNALVELRNGRYQEPNTRATVTEMFDGLVANSQNHLGSLKFDFMAINDLLWPFLSTGFYYKTFMWPKAFWEKIYEPVIRASAGLGRLSGWEDPDCYDKGFLHCDILIVGAGPSGLTAALSAARSGARVILADEDFLFGGRLNSETYEVDGMACAEWARNTVSELRSMNNIRLMSRTTVYGCFDHGIYGMLERKTDHLQTSNGLPRQVLWRVYSKRSIVCTGATERSIAFGNNDRPGVMLAGSVRAYVNRWGVVTGKRITIFTNNDDGWRTALDLASSGIEIAAVVDTRNKPTTYELSDAEIITGGKVQNVIGRARINELELTNGVKIKTDCLAVSGGWNPNIQLTCHHRGRPQWCDKIAAFGPSAQLPFGMVVAGAANGALTLANALRDGHDAGNLTAYEMGYNVKSAAVPNAEDERYDVKAFWYVGESKARAWIDLQNDVIVKDVEIANLEGFNSVEHLKRYTTLGMATDQGKTSNILALGVMAELERKSISDIGTSIFRPPYTPVPIGALAGRARGKEFRPTRLTPSHEWAKEEKAVFVDAGMWSRAQWFPQHGEMQWRQSVDREVLQTRLSVGVCDVTTLGKIDIQGKDAGIFLDKVYANGFRSLRIGRVRYGLMLREDGMAMDDGTTARFSEYHFIMTTTTANAVSVFRHMEFCRQCLWPNLDVHLISATEQWAQISVAGPNSRSLLTKIVDAEFDLSNEAFPFMSCMQLTICGGTPARLFRISFSGELAYEIAVPARYGDSLIRVLMSEGEEFAVVPYGTEALSVLRIEKGHPAGNELNGQTTALALGMGNMVSKKKDCIGNILSKRIELNRDDGLSLVGFVPINREEELKAGAHLISKGSAVILEKDEGWMSSVAYSPNLGHSIGLGFIKNGLSRKGEIVVAVDPLRNNNIDVEIVSPHFIDPEGKRLRA